MSEPIKLEDNKYEFQENDHILTCKRYGEDWRDFIGDKAVMALFLYTLKLQKIMANYLCLCGNTDNGNPELHENYCPFQIKIGELKND